MLRHINLTKDMTGSFEQLKIALRPLGKLQTTGLQHLKAECPNCLKSGGLKGKFNLEIDYKIKAYHCWACNIKGSLFGLIRKYGLQEYAPLFKTNKTLIVEKVPEQILELPKSISVLLNKEASDYLINKRKLTREIIKQRDIRYCYTGFYKDTIIFPSYNSRGELTYFCSHNYKTGKYRERKGKNHICFYESFIDKQSLIIITEGIYDALSVSNAIPLLGLKIRESFLDFLIDTDVLLALDSVVNLKAKLHIMQKLTPICKTVRTFDLFDEKDLNDLLVKDRQSLIENLLPYYIS